MLKIGHPKQTESIRTEELFVVVWILTEGTVRMPLRCTSLLTELDYRRYECSCECLADTFSPGSFRCDARAAVWRDPVCLQRGCLPRQSPALLHLQLRVDCSATGHRLRQLPVRSSFSIHASHNGTPRSCFTKPRLGSLPRVPTADFLKTSFAHFHSPAGSSGFTHIFFPSLPTGNILWLAFPVVLFAGDLQPCVDNQSKCN